MNKVTGIIFLVDDIVSSVKFYTKLGFRVASELPNIATRVQLGEFQIELLLKQKVVSEEYKEDIPARQKGAGAYLQIKVEDVDSFYFLAKSNDVQISAIPKNYPWSQREFIVIDPNGYKISFYSTI